MGALAAREKDAGGNKMPSCRSAINRLSRKVEFKFALAGNPNVGKSCIFNQLTGVGVETANYPGTSVEMNIASTEFEGHKIGIIDLPGTYSIGGVSEDQWVARQGLLDGKPDVVICIADATNLARNLFMVLQIIDLDIPVVLALNLIDQAEVQGIEIDAVKLSGLLGNVPVVQTVAICGKGLDDVFRKAIEVAEKGYERKEASLHYGHDIENMIEVLAREIKKSSIDLPYDLSPRANAINLLEKDEDILRRVEQSGGSGVVLDLANKISREIEIEHGEPSSLRIARERHGLAGAIAEEVEKVRPVKKPLSERLWYYTTAPLTGIPILIVSLAATFALLFLGGNLLASIFDVLWSGYISPPLDKLIFLATGHGVIAKTLIWGVDGGIAAALSVGIPYVLTFYFLLAFFEDSGYLNSAAFLMDKMMHKFGLHGRAIIPMIAGAGCNVPAIIGTRVLTSTRERIIASTLIVLVPCSARTAVILGAVSRFVGWFPAVTIYLITLLIIAVVGLLLNRIMPGEATGLVMEMFPFRMPSIGSIVKKTWMRLKAFLTAAVPIILFGSLVLGFLYESGIIWTISAPLSPVITLWLGLPLVTGVALIFAVLRKELALQLLVTLAIVKYGGQAKNLLHFMTKTQIYVYALVATLYFPCIATVAVLARELSWKRALGIMAFTTSLAVVIGGITLRLIQTFHLL